VQEAASRRELMAMWRHLIEPVLLDGIQPIQWDEALQLNARVTSQRESVLMTVDGDLGDSRVRTVVVAAGDMHDVCDLVAEMEDDARACGCKKVLYVGRQGWHRVMPGYKVAAVIGAKEL
jgi:hypothetical protein